MQIEAYKDILYIIGSILGIIGFFRTLKKRDKCEFSYRTVLGDEVTPYLVVTKGDILNLEITTEQESVFAYKYPPNTNISQIKYGKMKSELIDESSFFPILKETEFISIPNENQKMPLIFLQFEDRYHNNYYQKFSFNFDDVRNGNRQKHNSKSCYILSNRYWRFLWIWFPKIRV